MKILLPLMLLAIVGCASKNQKAKDVDAMTYAKNFDLQGHRGARGLFPENSIEGFLGALDLQVTTLELDVVISADSQVVVSHEPWIDRLICWDLDDSPVAEGKALNIFRMPYSEISNYNCGSQPHPNFPQQAKLSTFKPLLSEVLTETEGFCKKMELGPVWYNIEVKSTPDGDGLFHPEPKTYVALVLDVVRKGGIGDRTIIQSFDVRALREAKTADRTIPVALLISETEGFEKDLETLGFIPEIYSPYYRLVDEQMIKNCHSNGIRIIPWTVNEEDQMVHLLEMGVDGLITDYPDVALTLKL
ncbi:MAG: glycerophosphodiester phosphodiesterase [Flavobacteriales bacterium]|nr:glycerophosphodiester phosphodiesterase [Flavobacteriales bacterium]